MRKRNKRIIFGLLGLFIVLGICLYILKTRIWIDQYEQVGDTLVFANHVYVRTNGISDSDTKNVGKTIGIVHDGKRTLSDYLWPTWVMEYKDDQAHHRVFVRGFMDMGSVYNKQ